MSPLRGAVTLSASRRLGLRLQLLQDALNAVPHLGLPVARLGEELGLGRLALALRTGAKGLLEEE
jgi:hypothetical protein